ncbi:MAG: site-2 protease family protein [Calditrichaceae bacterium]|jgi:Zn-dependent protease/predicted transcriptional regulator
MFGRSIKLFKLFGFEVKMDLSWLILAILITWSLAAGLFPAYYHDFSTATYWWMGVFGAIGLLVSIVFHELSHSLVARRFDLPIRGITLFIFGGVAEMQEEPESARAELWMAIAGPIASIILGGILFGVHLLDIGMSWGKPVHGVLLYLSIINLVLAGFNLLPAFPLDGGRVLRAILWSWKKNLRWATKVSSRIGSGFGVLLIILGVISFIGGNFIGGVWWFLIGMFMRGASQQSYQQLLMRKALEGESIRHFMKQNPVTVEADTPLNKLVEDYIYKYHYKMYPVVSDSKISGCVNLKQVKNVTRDQWSVRKVSDVMDECDDTNTIDINTDAVKALSIMRKNNLSRLMVTDNSRLAGVVTLKDLLDFLSLKVDLEDV